MYRRLLAVVTSVFVFFNVANAYIGTNSFKLPDGVVPFDGELNARNVILMDMNSRTTLFEKASYDKVPIASVTKIMSLLLIMEALDVGQISYSDTVTTSYDAYKAGTQGTSIFLEPGETATVEELLTAVVVASANDATVALAEHVAGTKEAFVYMMNDRAKQLEMTNTEFCDPCGLNDDGVSTAYDVALMSRELILNYYAELKPFLDIYLTYYRDGSRDKAEILNTNRRFMRGYDKATGLKTGWTSIAGFCLSATAVQEDFHLNAVVLGCINDKSRYADVLSLMNYGFAQFESVSIATKDVPVAEIVVDKGDRITVDVVPTEMLSVLIKRGDNRGELVKETNIQSYVSAPINKGTKVGEIVVTRGDQRVGQVDLIVNEAVCRGSLLKLFWRIIGNWARVN